MRTAHASTADAQQVRANKDIKKWLFQNGSFCFDEEWTRPRDAKRSLGLVSRQIAYMYMYVPACKTG